MKLPSKMQDVRTISALLRGAEEHAHRTGESQPGAEHLLLSSLALPDGSARRAFQRVGADPDGLAEAIESQHRDALRAIGIRAPDDPALDSAPAKPRVYTSNASARSAFQAASELARADRRAKLTGAHVVAAVADMRNGSAARALATMGIDRAALATAAREEAAGG